MNSIRALHKTYNPYHVKLDQAKKVSVFIGRRVCCSARLSATLAYEHFVADSSRVTYLAELLFEMQLGCKR